MFILGQKRTADVLLRGFSGSVEPVHPGEISRKSMETGIESINGFPGGVIKEFENVCLLIFPMTLI